MTAAMESFSNASRSAHNKAATVVARQAQPSARCLPFLLTCCVELTTATGGLSTYQTPSILQNHKRRGRLHRGPCPMLAPGPCRLPAVTLRWTHNDSQHSATHPTPVHTHAHASRLPAVLLLLCDTALDLGHTAAGLLYPTVQRSYGGDCRGGGSGGGPGGVAATCGRQAGWLCHCDASTPPTRCCWSTWQRTQGQAHEYHTNHADHNAKAAANPCHSHTPNRHAHTCCRYSCTTVGCALRSQVGGCTQG